VVVAVEAVITRMTIPVALWHEGSWRKNGIQSLEDAVGLATRMAVRGVELSAAPRISRSGDTSEPALILTRSGN